MKIIVTHLSGNRNVRSVLSALEKHKNLFTFNTTIAIKPNSFLVRQLPNKLATELNRRVFPIDYKLINTNPILELGRNIFPRIGLKQTIKHETGIFSIGKVCDDLDKKTAKILKTTNAKSVDAVYCYEDIALNTFKMAHSLGIQCLYDLPIGYWRTARKLMEIERERWPEWFPTINGFNDSEKKLQHKDEELSLADRIYVASTFTANSLKDYQGKLAPIEIIPYGFPPVAINREYSSNMHRRLKLLFVGGLSQRKGIADLFAAVENLSDYVELTVVGQKTNTYSSVLDVELAKHTWIPTLSHDAILSLMRELDVLIFPSLFEGFGLVITEAMSQGMPVITTDRTAGPDLINNGVSGWIVEAGSSQSLQKAIEKLLNNPYLIADSGLAAMEVAKSRPWETYGFELSQSIKKHLSNI